MQVKYEMVRRARVDGEPVGRTAAAFGFSRPSFYAAQRALDEGGLAGLVPARPGPRGAHKLTAEVVAFAREQRAADPKLSSAGLVELIAESVRGAGPSPLGRACARSRRASKARETDDPAGARDDVARYEQLRARALEGDASGWRLGLAVLEHRGVVAWVRAWSSTLPVPACPAPSTPAAVSDELVGALASMALACVAGR